MKNYTKPEVEITRLNNEDVMAATKSGGLVLTNFQNAADADKKYNVIDNF